MKFPEFRSLSSIRSAHQHIQQSNAQEYLSYKSSISCPLPPRRHSLFHPLLVYGAPDAAAFVREVTQGLSSAALLYADLRANNGRNSGAVINLEETTCD